MTKNISQKYDELLPFDGSLLFLPGNCCCGCCGPTPQSKGFGGGCWELPEGQSNDEKPVFLDPPPWPWDDGFLFGSNWFGFDMIAIKSI